MRKKSVKVSKVIAIAVGMAILALVATQAYAAISHDEDWAIWQRLVSYLNRVKNEPNGCCLPLCESLGKTICGQRTGEEENPNWVDKKCSKIAECKAGCCQVECTVKDLPKAACESMDGSWAEGKCEVGCCDSESGKQQLPEKTCEECTGGQWNEGECDKPKQSKGYSFHATASVSMTYGPNEPVTGTIKGTMDLHTCEDIYSTWEGRLVTEQTLSAPQSGLSPQTQTFTDKASIGIGAPQVKGNRLVIKIPAPPAGEFVFEGPIIEGAPECQ